MDQQTVEQVKSALRQKAEEMIQTISISYEELEELSKQSQDELKSLHGADVAIEIGKLALVRANCVSLKHLLNITN